MLSDEDAAIVTREGQMNREKRLYRSGLPTGYWNCSWEDFRETPENQEMREAVIGYQNGWDRSMHSGKGLLLEGRPGAGKTMAASLLGLSLLDQGLLVRFVPLAAYIERLQRQFTFTQSQDWDAWRENDDWLHIVRNVANLVILDDVGKEYRTHSGYAEDAFDLFLRERIRLGRPVVMTSNLLPAKWTKVYSPSMASFIYEAATIVTVNSKTDMRRD